jgi:glyoxylase-like metal-dependent hydrolase (beta-lactamase superfamily II)
MRVFHLQLPMRTVDGAINERIKLSSTIVQTDSLLFIVDTGWVHYPNDLLLELKKWDFSPEQFDLVINTHVHPDHIGNNYLFENARYVVSSVDFEAAKAYAMEMKTSINPYKTFIKYFPHYPPRLAERHAAYSKKLIGKFWKEEFFGNPDRMEWIENRPELPPNVSLVKTAGHTLGHYAVALNGTIENVYITGDALPAKIFWKRKLRERAPRWDPEAFEKSKILVENFEGIIISGHDKPFRTADRKYITQTIIDLA